MQMNVIKYSQMEGNFMDFKFLSVFQQTTFILGIVFAILTLAVVFYNLMHKAEYKSVFVKILFTIITPLVMFIMWFSCLFAGIGAFNSNEVYVFLMSIVCGIAVMALTYGIAKLIEILLEKKNTSK